MTKLPIKYNIPKMDYNPCNINFSESKAHLKIYFIIKMDLKLLTKFNLFIIVTLLTELKYF